ncbi:MAG: hypothetical protein JWN22_2122 [Nocardioides sp.]|nr:hypothetical protein [Nocardioides sp.]
MTRHLLVIGAQRCGTTYLATLLDAHPQIAMARPARPEPKVFLSGELAARGLDWDRTTYFAHATDERLLGEKSTSYLEHAEAADRAADVLGDPLVLVQLRDPVERAMSHWAFSTDSGLEKRPLADVLAANLEGPLPWDPALTSVSPFAYLERGRYVDHLAPWLSRFGADLTVLLLEEMVADPGTVAGLYARLGVDPAHRPADAAVPVNESRQPRPPLDADLLRRLRDHFRASDRALAELIGRPLPWAPRAAAEAQGGRA